MRYTDIVIDDLIVENSENTKGSFIVNTTDELVDIINDTRARFGYTDLVKWELDNDTYYSFYLRFDTNLGLVDLSCEVAHGENDDYVWYMLPTTEEEKKMLLFKIIKYMLDNTDDMC